MALSTTVTRFLLSWRTATILLALINLKAVPFSWHVRLLYQFIKYWYTPQRVQQALQEAAANGTIHPIFDSVSIYSHAPAYEADYNLHKSNSTYFSDLDESRTALMTKLYASGMRTGSKQLEAAGYHGHTNVILGSVHTSFHKEIKPYERYEVRSRVLGWDQKWCVIGTFFIRPAPNKKDEVLLASSLSKYVTKKGRYTVAPEKCLRAAGWLPERPAETQAAPDQRAEDSNSSNDTVVPSNSDRSPDVTEDTNDIAAPAPEAAVNATEIVDRLEGIASHIEGETSTMDISTAIPPRAVEWDWHRIEMERLRGLQVAQNWLALDKALVEEYTHREKSMQK